MSSSPFDLSYMFGHIVRGSPFLIVAIAGIALCMTRDSRPLRVRVAVGCALAIQFVAHLILPLFYGQPQAYTEIRRSTIALNGSFFHTQRMVLQYLRNAYLGVEP